MDVLFAAGSRSGSEFSISLILALVGHPLAPFARVNSAREGDQDRQPIYETFKAIGDAPGYVAHHNLTALKLEDPGIDGDADAIYDRFPAASVVGTYRPAHKIANSHGNIRPWGMAADRVVSNWIANLAFFERAAADDRLVMIPLEDKSAFSPKTAAQRMGIDIAGDWAKFEGDWPVINELVEQKKISGDATPADVRIDKDELWDRFPALAAADARYKHLVKICN